MQKTLKISLGAVFLTAIATLAILVAYQSSSSIATAQESEGHAENTENTQQAQDSKNYTYTAQPGDSYTLMARKAIQTYGVDNKADITQSGIIFAETNITNEAGIGELAIGQQVTIDGELIKKWAESAQKLTDAEKQAWGVYVPLADFNTNNVGENR